ncbi:MAG: hypothetical protein P8M04_05115 [Akkermansiaceae bacterium]|nr:hypothetical protein [Akkermansiaceae bacterium]
MKILVCTVLLSIPFSSLGRTLGHWRFDEADAAVGGSVLSATNVVNEGTFDAIVAGGNPLYSDDVPAAEIFDPIAGTTLSNKFSLDATASKSQFSVIQDTSFESSFTVEFFVKYIGAPPSYQSIMTRRETRDLGWQIDFDHGNGYVFGRIRSRWDTPAGDPDNIDDRDVDENWNFILGPQGNKNALKVYVDTGAKDALGADVGPQNTGNTNDYLYDADSANPNEVDVSLQGDGINDDEDWHHVALTFDEDTGEIRFYFDHNLSQSRTLSDSEGDGYTHPFADLLFGKLTNVEYGLLMDEVRLSNSILTPSHFLRVPLPEVGSSVGYWRMEEEDAVEGGDIFFVDNETSDLHGAGFQNGSPKYSADVPSAIVYDPISGESLTNTYSLDASVANSRLRVTDTVAFDSSFTLELFIKLGGEPGGYHSFVRRQETAEQRWQIDFDHTAKGSFGRGRVRMDTPDGDNVNFVAAELGWTNISGNRRIWVDTDSGDGLPTSYDDAVDWALDGDGINDNARWHHVAISFDEESQEISFYLDYQLSQSRRLADSDASGYVHPAAPIDFGKLTNADYALFVDEVRYTGAVLSPIQFLQAVNSPVGPAAELAITSVVYDPSAPSATVTWNSTPGNRYSLDYSTDLNNWLEILEEEIADEDTFSYTDTDLEGGQSRIFYRVREYK